MSPPRSSLILLLIPLMASACGPETATTDPSATGTTGDASSSSTGPMSTSSASDPTTTDPTTTTDTTTSTSDTTTADTTTGGACVEFFAMEYANEFPPPMFTCNNTAELCPSDLGAALFKFENTPENKDAKPTTEDLDRVHCLLEALRDRQRGTFPFELSYALLGTDTGTIEIAGEFAIWRREVISDFNYDYSERALWLESGKVFSLCRGQNTAIAAWDCLRRYFVTFPVMAECVEAPLVCPR